MNAGRLRHKISIIKETTEQNSYGEPTQSYDYVYQGLYASVDPILGREYFAAKTENSEITHRVKLRYKPGIKPNMMVQFGNRYFDIKSSIDYQERHVELQLMCIERVGQEIYVTSTHAQLEQYTHEQLEEYTHGEIALHTHGFWAGVG